MRINFPDKYLVSNMGPPKPLANLEENEMDRNLTQGKRFTLISLMVFRDLLSLITLIAIILLIVAMGKADNKRAQIENKSNLIEVLDATYYMEHAEKRSKLA